MYQLAILFEIRSDEIYGVILDPSSGNDKSIAFDSSNSTIQWIQGIKVSINVYIRRY
jgi:hypothetical protein